VLRLQAQLPLAPADRLGFGTFPMHALALSPDGRRLAWTGVHDGGVRMIFVRALDGSEATPLPGSEGAGNPEFSPDGEWIAFFANQKLKTISVAGGGARILADAPNVLGGMVWDRADRILFSPSPGTGIWQVDPNGGGATPVTEPDPGAGEGSHVWPARVPGTDLVLYVAEIEAADSFDAGRIYAFDPATGKRVLLVDGGSDPTVVEDTLYFARAGIIFAARFDRARTAIIGSPKPVIEGVSYTPATGAAQFAVTRSASVHVPGEQGWDLWQPVIVDRAGVETLLDLPANSYQQLRLSPDGRRVALQITAADDDIWVYDLERRVLARVTNANENLHPAWGPDGQWLIFAHHGTPTPPPPTLYRRRADGSGEAEPLLAPEGALGARLHPDVSPDGSRVVYSRYSPEDNFDLFVFDLRTREDTLWLRTQDADILPRWSPDARWIAWTRAPNSAPGQVMVQSAQGESRRWQISTEGGINPQWRRDGRGLFFAHAGGIYEVDVAAGEDLAPSPPRLLFQGDYAHRYAAFPEGERFLMLRRVPEPGAGGPIRLELAVSAKD
jgi:Tol biopolymer transport system component